MPSAGCAPAGVFDIAPGYKSIKHHLRAREQQAVDYELLQALIATDRALMRRPCRPRAPWA